MRGLEDDMPELVALDEIRVRSAELRNAGRTLLQSVLEQDIDKWDDKPTPQEVSDRAVVIRALSHPSTNPPLLRKAVTKLAATKPEAILGKGGSRMLLEEGGSMPFLSAARAVTALASAPSGAISASMMLFYYVVMRELYYADAPDWVVGGCRAGAGGQATAYVTGQAVRAMLSFERTLRRTAQYVAGVRELIERSHRDGYMIEWLTEDNKRKALSLYTTIATRSWNLALPLENPVPIPVGDDAAMSSFRQKIRWSFIKALDAASMEFSTALKTAEQFRAEEKENPSVKSRLSRSATAHDMAIEALQEGRDVTVRARELFPWKTEKAAQAAPEHAFSAALESLEKEFVNAADRVRRAVVPARGYLSSILDHELSLAAAGNGAPGTFEAHELAHAAASFGAASSAWDDERLTRAGTYLNQVLAERGSFPVGRPFHLTRSGSHYQENLPQTLVAYAQLVEYVDRVPLSPEVARTLVRLLEQHMLERGRVVLRPRRDKEKLPHIDKFWTAVSILALERVNRTLDERINRKILGHFTVRRPSPPRLDDLFYPDYGLCQYRKNGEAPARPQSIAIVLERMRAHVARVPLEGAYEEPLFSAILYGPPGTGKTTLIGALASSCGVPLVSVTPSDIIVGGAEKLEQRARDVFRALALLTRVVILFDEFDPVLRAGRGKEKDLSVFEFLTPGMLPKLKDLHDQARRRSVAYALLTNYVGSLDEAAIRSGRFDEKIGVYPPDALSRAGRLWSELHAYVYRDAEINNNRFRKVVMQSAGAPMETLGRPGWFSRPAGPLRRGTPFHYILEGDASVEWPEVEAMPIEKSGSGPHAEREQKERQLIASWELSPDNKHVRGEWPEKLWKELDQGARATIA